MCSGGDETDLGNGLFEPITIKWNKEPFVVELEPECQKGYALEHVALEDYFPDLYDNPEAAKDLPWEEIRKLHILTLYGSESTLEIHLLLDRSVAFVPSLVQTTGTGIGNHNGGALVYSGKAYPILRCSAIETVGEKKGLIKIHQAAHEQAAAERTGIKSRVTANGEKPQQSQTLTDAASASSSSENVMSELAKNKERVDRILEYVQHIPKIGNDIAAILHEELERAPTQSPRKEKRKRRKRESRAANIDGIKRILQEHLRAARDHAYNTQKREGVPKLLPRPTQAQLAEQLNVSVSSVSRAINDSGDRETKFLWEVAIDVDKIMGIDR